MAYKEKKFCTHCLKDTLHSDGECTNHESVNLEDPTYQGIQEHASPTGSLRFNTGKPNMSNIPPEFLLGMAEVLTQGEAKYGKNNWKKGNYTSVPYDSAMRHILKWQAGERLDEESKENHLFHAAVNIMMMWYYEENFPDMDDREKK